MKGAATILVAAVVASAATAWAVVVLAPRDAPPVPAGGAENETVEKLRREVRALRERLEAAEAAAASSARATGPSSSAADAGPTAAPVSASAAGAVAAPPAERSPPQAEEASKLSLRLQRQAMATTVEEAREADPQREWLLRTEAEILRLLGRPDRIYLTTETSGVEAWCYRHVYNEEGWREFKVSLHRGRVIAVSVN
jgi:hypothetical protein